MTKWPILLPVTKITVNRFTVTSRLWRKGLWREGSWRDVWIPAWTREGVVLHFKWLANPSSIRYPNISSRVFWSQAYWSHTTSRCIFGHRRFVAVFFVAAIFVAAIFVAHTDFVILSQQILQRSIRPFSLRAVILCIAINHMSLYSNSVFSNDVLVHMNIYLNLLFHVSHVYFKTSLSMPCHYCSCLLKPIKIAWSRCPVLN